jgi:ketosteroid isomerase-like protein
MKFLNSFLALTALTLATSVAQEESPASIPSDEENASATVQATPEETKSPSTPVESPATSPTAGTKERPSATVTPGSRKTEAATGTTKTAAESASQPGKKMSVEATIKDNENRWEAAIASRDASTVEGFLAPDFIGISWKGKFLNRSGLLGEFKSDKDTYKSTKIEKLNVRPFGKDVVVTTGRAREKGTDKDGKPFDRTYLFTDTWMQRNGQWQCVAAQVTLRGEK